MPGIYHDITIDAPLQRVRAAIMSPQEIDRWWTLKCEGRPELGGVYRFYFGPDYDWYAEVILCGDDRGIEWCFTKADEDWTGTRLRIHATRVNGTTRLRLEHTAWRDRNDHFRRSSYCWAQYLRLLKVYLEQGVITPYGERRFG
ncbi:MAG: SRPBCC domain-containing protein [Bacteroidota bacterium]|nr:SRPBCC domain-containing protein [Bacteroidota bacterium]MDE2955671.1 SRPBCC domain-containing protein [Bacteroidota bacterium]